MKIKNWTACVQDRGKWKKVVEKAKTQLGSLAPGRRRRGRGRRGGRRRG
jgi:hypothetical protein